MYIMRGNLGVASVDTLLEILQNRSVSAKTPPVILRDGFMEVAFLKIVRGFPL
jgi:hypothetical protein